jgi:hypothetical protein
MRGCLSEIWQTGGSRKFVSVAIHPRVEKSAGNARCEVCRSSSVPCRLSRATVAMKSGLLACEAAWWRGGQHYALLGEAPAPVVWHVMP